MGWKWYGSLSHIRTDNAQVDSRIVPVLPRVGGFVAEVSVKEHQLVKAGDLLARIDDRDYRARLAQAEADLALAVAGAGSAHQTGQAGAQVQAARANAAGGALYRRASLGQCRQGPKRPGAHARSGGAKNALAPGAGPGPGQRPCCTGPGRGQ